MDIRTIGINSKEFWITAKCKNIECTHGTCGNFLESKCKDLFTCCVCGSKNGSYLFCIT